MLGKFQNASRHFKMLQEYLRAHVRKTEKQ